jgi:hypothetical protein
MAPFSPFTIVLFALYSVDNQSWQGVVRLPAALEFHPSGDYAA